jgi:hypothetical protein
MIVKILAGFAVVVVILVVVISMRPGEFRVSRSIAISAQPATVFEQVNNLRKWKNWSPWAKLDPDAKEDYTGPAEGTGASFHWSGNRQVGEGRLAIVESRPAEYVRFQLEFLRPFKASNIAEFTFKPDGNQTLVTWTMSGRNNFLAKAFSLFMDCEKMVGPDFEKGLAQMKSVAESTAQK